MSDFEQRQELIQAFMAERQLDALILQRVSSFAWATCGAASYVNTATTTGEATLFITSSGRHVAITDRAASRSPSRLCAFARCRASSVRWTPRM